MSLGAHRLCLVAVLLAGCASQHARSSNPAPAPAASGRSTHPSSSKLPSLSMVQMMPDSTIEGRASYYSRRFVGHKTASGERYDPNLYTAAHSTFPMGTVLRVTRLPDGPSVQVRVNDRCGCTHGRMLDLSEAAARRLNMLRDGSAPVRVQVVRRP